MRQVKLTVVPRPAQKTRTYIITPIAGPAFHGHAAEAPQYCCGTCGTVLLEGVHEKQFINAEHPVRSAGADVQLIDYGVGDYLISGTVDIPAETVTAITHNGPLILTCGHC